VEITAELVRRLLSARFPHWAGLPLRRVPSAGTDNAMFRLGPDLVVRLPVVAGAAATVEVERRWLPLLAPVLPLAIPEPLGVGGPADGFPYPWAVYRWLDGRDAVGAPPADEHDTAVRLGRFVAALWRFSATGGPPSFRGGPVGTRDAGVRVAIRDLAAEGVVDACAAIAVWESVMDTPAWTGDPVWVHADLHPANLLTRRGRLTAVIDFGGLGVGDPACDLLPAWTLLTDRGRDLFRAEVDVDDATWARGRGWGLCFGLGGVRAHRRANPVLAAISHHAMTQALLA
jgi:aminoglycoside phosphotransferase (APT) family kinase protein